MPRKASESLSQSAALKASCPASKPHVFVTDASTPGLQLKVYRNGRKGWWYQYAGSRVKIGDFPGIGYADARAKAQEFERMRAEGKDPRASVYDPKTATHLADVINSYGAYLDGRRSNGGHKFRNQMKLMVSKLGSTAVSAITPHVLRNFMEAHYSAKNAGQAHRVVSQLATAFNRAMQPFSGFAFPAGYRNPADNLADNIDFIRDRTRGSYAVSWEDNEWKSVMAAILRAYEPDSRISPVGVMCVEMMLLTGARPSEIQTLQWSEIEDHNVKVGDVTYKLKRIVKESHKTWKKTGRPRYIILAKEAMKLLDRAKKYAEEKGYDGPYVFPSPGRQVNKVPYLATATHYTKKIAELGGLSDLKPYNFRSAYINHALDQNVPLETVAENVGHEDIATTSQYYMKNKDSKIAAGAMKADEGFAKLRGVE